MVLITRRSKHWQHSKSTKCGFYLYIHLISVVVVALWIGLLFLETAGSIPVSSCRIQIMDSQIINITYQAPTKCQVFFRCYHLYPPNSLQWSVTVILILQARKLKISELARGAKWLRYKCRSVYFQHTETTVSTRIYLKSTLTMNLQKFQYSWGTLLERK